MLNRPKTYSGPAKEFVDPVTSLTIMERENVAAKQLDWRGEEDVERICGAFIEFLWSSSKTTFDLLIEEKKKQKRKKAQEEEEANAAKAKKKKKGKDPLDLKRQLAHKED